MDLAEDENFAFKHPYFFKNYTFKFENLKPEVKENFENIVKNMGAIVSDESHYVFTDILSTPIDQNKNYYSLSYLSNSILAEEPLEIEDYKCSNLVQDANKSGFCCLTGRYIIKNKSCMSYINQNICCKPCIEKTGLLEKNHNLSIKQDNGETNNANINDFNEEPNLHIDQTNNLQLDKSIDLPNVQHEINNLDENSNGAHISDENHNASDQLPTNGTSQNNEVNDHKNDSSDFEIIEINCNANVDKSSCSTEYSKTLKTNKPPSIDKWKRVRTVSSSSDASSSDIRNPTNKRKNKRQRLSSSPSIETTSNTSSSNESAQDEHQNFIEKLNTNMNKKKWWLYLPTPRRNPNYREPETKLRGRGRDFSYGEKRLMIAYLVVNDLIHRGTSRKPWKNMLEKGYLQDRTAESLNNHYRKILLPGIETFKLPKDIEKEFISVRKLHVKCR